MDKISFDKFGHLTPYEIIEIDLKTFQNNFVDNMDNNAHRNILFQEYLHYTRELCKIVTNQYFQWVNGSFVTQKSTPKDIDLVSFIDYRLIEKHHQKLKNFIYPLSKEIYNVDGYIVKLYPVDDKNLIFSKSDTSYWFHHFQKSRPNKNGERFYKGFIKIDLSHENL